MAPKKTNKPNGFTIFTRELMAKSREKLTFNQAIAKANPIWKNMSQENRAPYHNMAKQQKNGPETTAEKRNNFGTSVTEVEKEKLNRVSEEWKIKRKIEMAVRSSVNLEEFETQPYYFIMVNYFTRSIQGGVYVPAEISLSKFSLREGVIKKYHTFVNPGVDMYGTMHEAQEHANATHQLPLPPKAMGDRDLARIYRDIINFIRNEIDDDLPPIYTHRDAVPIVQYVLKFLAIDVLDCDIELNVYSLQYLLFIMKEASCEIGELPKIPNHHITDTYFDNDVLEFHVGLSCDFHEELDRSKYCTLSLVTRWAYMFCAYMCHDVAITPIPGFHMPHAVRPSFVVVPSSSHNSKRNRDDNDPHCPSCYKKRKSSN